MTSVLLTIHLIVTIALVVTVLLQRSEGGALGIGDGPGGLMTGRAAATLLSRSTAVLGGLFFLLAILLSVVPNLNRNKVDSEIIGSSDVGTVTAPAPEPAKPVESAPAQTAPATTPADDASAQPQPQPNPADKPEG